MCFECINSSSKPLVLSEAYLEPCQTSKVNRFAKIVEGWKLLIIFAKVPIRDVWQGSEYVSELNQTSLRMFISSLDAHHTEYRILNELSSHIGSYIRLKVFFEFLWYIFVNKVVCHRILIDLFTNSTCLSQFCVNGQSIFC